MKRLLRILAAPALVVLALGATMLVPTAASAMNEHRDGGYSRSRGWDGERVRPRYSRYWDDEDEARPRRRFRTETLERRHRAAQQRKNRFVAQTRQRRQIAKQGGRRVVHKRPATRQAARPVEKRTVRKNWPPAVMGSHGIASYYWQPQRVAAGGWFNPDAMTAAHRTLPFGTRVRVTHVASGKSVEVKINDRGPYIAGRIIDLSRAAAGVIGMTQQGIARVAVEVLGR
jgi:rare lipoprotein A